MKQYLLFTFEQYYPSGGWEDFKEDFDDLNEAKKQGISYIGRGGDYFHVVDLLRGLVVYDSFTDNMSGLL